MSIKIKIPENRGGKCHGSQCWLAWETVRQSKEHAGVDSERAYRYKIAVAPVFVCENGGIAIESWIGMDLRPVIVEELPWQQLLMVLVIIVGPVKYQAANGLGGNWLQWF